MSQLSYDSSKMNSGIKSGERTDGEVEDDHVAQDLVHNAWNLVVTETMGPLQVWECLDENHI